MFEVLFDVYDESACVINKNLAGFLVAINKDLLEGLYVFLKLFDRAIDQLDDKDKPTIQKFIPITQLLINYCEIKFKDNDSFKVVKRFVGE